ncbi:MAG TPA: CHASE2 domain-containing protein [Bdellovibrionota bacterium]|nr:CHASE2 domain-containing protein [Bdellovibrionota bacterium]
MQIWKFIQWLGAKFEKPIIIVAGAAGLTSLLLNLDFNLLEANLYDLRMSRGSQAAADSSIVLITLDEQTTRELNEFSPLPLDLHAKLLESLETSELKALGYLVDFNRVDQVNPELFKGEWGRRFVDAAVRMETRGTTVLLGTPFDVTGEMLPPYPLSQLEHSIAVIHKDGNVFSEDKVTRRALVELNDKSVFHMEMARKLGFIYPKELPRGTFYVPEADASYFFFRYHGSTATGFDRSTGQAFPYPTVSFVDVLDRRVPPETFRGKIALVGTLGKDDAGDYAFTPYSKAAFTNPKLLIHANILDSIIHNRALVRAPNWANWLVTFAVTAFVLWWVMNSTPLYGVFATLTLVFLMIAFGQLLFQVYGLWIRESQPLVGIFIGYYVVVPYRLIREYKKRWDYQRKNELLTQVEELKTNFLNLVTHDLKTPVARIQGLAEVLLAKTASLLPASERETLKHIIHSTDELNHFISSILELSKVETNRLAPNLESRDINQLIERAVEFFTPSARAKRIELVPNLEPLFPIRIDASLVSKVINNLIDNALKYSPAESQVKIESREVNLPTGVYVEISVQDEGIGLTEEERENLFTRFYRAKNDTTAQVAGTGLGLYLTKYFVEAHQGIVTVESEKGKGSRFKICLPMDLVELKRPQMTETIQPIAEPAAKPGLVAAWFIQKFSKSEEVKENANV